MQTKFIIGIDEAGRSQNERASPYPYNKYIIGIDEAGRGPLAGPVVVAGIRVRTRHKHSGFFRNIRDSKKLSPKQREQWFRRLTDHPKIEWAVARVWPSVIDRINIAQAANLGACRVYKKLCPRINLGQNTQTLLDGSLHLSTKTPHETIVKGDEKIPVISAASIIAKVTRDRIMLRLHKKYPHYRFDVHKGYGTKKHREMLKRFGRSRVHRKSFRLTKHKD
ncbi:MAG: ribonuclease HII [Candidatus Sungiibacteriota bacterium]|uniref:Ribonuclease n=1 Tax=Candidatus Sungiibacteriota bacterium TaxID=2750080 RepID=A0A7T5UR35_9BACT|nr:MAG: ribonuclease HII [Candidatus Sungbacteria bacterium]